MPYFDWPAKPGAVIDFDLGNLRAAFIRDRWYKSMHLTIKSQILGDFLAHSFQRAPVVMQLYARYRRYQTVS
jgi:hypothetical protein